MSVNTNVKKKVPIWVDEETRKELKRVSEVSRIPMSRIVKGITKSLSSIAEKDPELFLRLVSGRL